MRPLDRGVCTYERQLQRPLRLGLALVFVARREATWVATQGCALVYTLGAREVESRAMQKAQHAAAISQ